MIAIGHGDSVALENEDIEELYEACDLGTPRYNGNACDTQRLSQRREKKMHKFRLVLLLISFIVFAQVGSAQSPIRAKSETGKDVLLYPDGTWKYAPDSAQPATAVTGHN